MATDWSRGYSAQWRMCSVDPTTWEDGASVGRIVSVDVSRDSTGDAPLLETATVHLLMDDPSEFDTGWYRIGMLAVQDDEAERVDVFTGLFESVSDTWQDGVYDVELSGRSVLAPAADIKLAVGDYTPQGADGAQVAADELIDATPAPVSVSCSFALGKTIVHDLGASVLAKVWKILKAGGCIARISGDGRISIMAEPTIPSAYFGATDMRITQDGVGRSYDRTEIPNRYVAVDTDTGETAVARNDDPESTVSHASRGRWVDIVDDSPDPLDDETLSAYAERKLQEASTVTSEITYRRKYDPGITVGDCIGLPQGTARIEKMSLECGAGIEVSETAAIEEVLYAI